MTTWKQKIAQDTARVQGLPNYLGNMRGGSCACFFYPSGDRLDERVCVLPDGHKGAHSDKVDGDVE